MRKLVIQLIIRKKTAMTTPSNNEPAKSSETYSMDGGVPTGTEKPYGKAGSEMDPFEENVNEVMNLN